MTKSLKNLFFLFASGLGILVLQGCETVGKTLDLDTDLMMEFRVAADINPDESKTSSPLFVRFYELKTDNMFAKAEFIDLYERDEEVLGADLIAKQELKRLIPGKNRSEKFVLNPETRYIALFAEFYQYRGSQHRLIIPVQANNVFQDEIAISVSRNIIRIIKNN